MHITNVKIKKTIRDLFYRGDNNNIDLFPKFDHYSSNGCFTNVILKKQTPTLLWKLCPATLIFDVIWSPGTLKESTQYFLQREVFHEVVQRTRHFSPLLGVKEFVRNS